MADINFDKMIWEGWTVGDFIDELSPMIEMVMSGNSWQQPLANFEELKQWCIDNQPYYKEYIPEVVQYFAEQYNIY